MLTVAIDSVLLQVNKFFGLIQATENSVLMNARLGNSPVPSVRLMMRQSGHEQPVFMQKAFFPFFFF